MKIVMRKYFLSKLILIFMFSFSFGKAQDNSARSNTERPKIGLVLSGGGARGAAHVGILKVLEENHIPVDMIAGTSFGAIVGGLYATGYSADELEKILNNIDWQQTLSSSAPRTLKSFRRKKDDNGFQIKLKISFDDGELKLPSGLITPNNLRLTLGDLVSHNNALTNFDNLTIPFRAVATDLETGEAVILDRGDLASSMIASMAVPALFPPVERNGKLLVDGGIANNIPIDIVREMGADIIIAVDISEDLMTKEDINSFADVIDQLTMLQSKKIADAQIDTLNERDVFIKPDLKGISFVDFENAINAVPRGQDAALSHLVKLKKLSLNQEAWQQYSSSHGKIIQEQPIIDFIKITNDTKLSDEVIKSYISLKPGQKLNQSQLINDLTKIYGLELFEKVDYRIIDENGQTGLNIQTTQKEYNEDYIRFGLALQESFEGDNGFQLSASFTNLVINKQGGELQAIMKVGEEFGLFTEIYQPLDYNGRFYVYANALGRRYNRNLSDDSDSRRIILRSRVSEAKFQIGTGINFDNWGTGRIGIERLFGNARDRNAFPSNPIPFDRTIFTSSFMVDTLDNISFPLYGTLLDVKYENNSTIFKGDDKIDKFQVSGYTPFTWGDNTLGFKYKFLTSFNGIPRETDSFHLGGFLQLSAFAPGQVAGYHGGSLAAVYYHKIIDGAVSLGDAPIYIGATIETGNVWNRRSDISFNDLKWSSSLFIGADTVIGPIYLGGGIGDGGQASAFLYVGQLF